MTYVIRKEIDLRWMTKFIYFKGRFFQALIFFKILNISRLFIFADKYDLRFSIQFWRKIFRKSNIAYRMTRRRKHAYQRVRNVSFLENFVCVLNGWSPYRNLENTFRN